MTEILTESFCERCGTRYTFESSAPRQRRLGGLKVLGKGLKNFVMSDDSSLDEALAAARSDAERDATAHQLDAFHATFNFCMSCRQYTCANCWNEPEARCLSCAPLALVETVPAMDEVDPERLLRFMGGPAAEAPAPIGEPAIAHVHVSELVGDEVHEAELAAAARADAEAAAIEGLFSTVAEQEPEIAAEPEAPVEFAEGPVPAAVAQPEPMFAAAPEASAAELAETSTAASGEPGELAAEPDAAAIGGLEPGQSIDDAIAAYEAALATEAFAVAGEPAAVAEVLAEPEPLADLLGAPIAEAAAPVAEAAAPVAEAESIAQPEPETPAAPVVEPAPEPIAAAEAAPEPAAEAAPEPEPEPVAAVETGTPGVDVIDQPVWPAPGAPATPLGPPPEPGAPPAWPTGPRWPTAIPAHSAPPPAAPAVDPLAALMARSATDAMWAASSRDVVQPIAAAQPIAAVQPCTKCGISLSASARFCRRCGTPQG